MLANREDEKWSLTPHEERDYGTETERAFFAAIENPPAPSQELKDMFLRYGKYLKK